MQITRLSVESHEDVYRVEDADARLLGFIAVHSTQLGPGAGGLRMRPYESEAAALEDVLRLSRGMTFKNAAAGLPLGGGKAVILGDPSRQKTPALLAAMGRAVESLQGRYWTAEDMGMTPADMALLARETRFVAGLAACTGRGIRRPSRRAECSTRSEPRLGSGPVRANPLDASWRSRGLGRSVATLASFLRMPARALSSPIPIPPALRPPSRTGVQTLHRWGGSMPPGPMSSRPARSGRC